MYKVHFRKFSIKKEYKKVLVFRDSFGHVEKSDIHSSLTVEN